MGYDQGLWGTLNDMKLYIVLDMKTVLNNPKIPSS